MKQTTRDTGDLKLNRVGMHLYIGIGYIQNLSKMTRPSHGLHQLEAMIESRYHIIKLFKHIGRTVHEGPDGRGPSRNLRPKPKSAKLAYTQKPQLPGQEKHNVHTYSYYIQMVVTHKDRSAVT